MSEKSTVELVRKFIEASLWDIDSTLESLSDDAVFMYMFPPTGFRERYEGREEIEPLLRMARQLYVKAEWTNLVLHVTDDPELVVATTNLESEIVNGRILRGEHCIFARVRDGKIVEFRIYFNPIKLNLAIDGLVETSVSG